MASTPGLELLHWWEASALTSAPPLLPITVGLLTVLNAISFSHVICPLDNEHLRPGRAWPILLQA